MTILVKDFIKFIAGVIILIMIFTVIFSPEGIASNTFNYLVFVEPILLQDYISTTLAIGSYSSGEFYSSVDSTGQPHTIKIYTVRGVTYVSVEPSQEIYLKTKFASIDPTAVLLNCTVLNQTIKLQEGLISRIIIEKTLNRTSGFCNMMVFV